MLLPHGLGLFGSWNNCLQKIGKLLAPGVKTISWAHSHHNVSSWGLGECSIHSCWLLCLCWLSLFELSFPFWFVLSFSGFFFPSSFFVCLCVCVRVLSVWWWWRWWWWWEKFDKSKTKTEQKLNKLQISVPTLWLTLSESGRVVKLDEKFWLS